MSLRHLAIPLFILLMSRVALVSSEHPWTDVWTMDLRNEERSFVDHAGSSWLLATADDFDDDSFLDGKEVALLAKFARMRHSGPLFYRLPQLTVAGNVANLATAADGDNIYLLGRVTRRDEHWHLAVAHVVPSRSDADIIAGRLAELDEHDWEGRLAVAAWVREQAASEGNHAFWTEAADEIVLATVRSAAALAARSGDVDLQIRAMSWATEVLGQRELAAELGSAPWLADAGPEADERIGAIMRGLGMVLHQGPDGSEWMNEQRHLSLTYEQRLAEMHWRDAEGFYQLGRWADRHADILPRAAEMAHRAYMQGLRGDETHAGLRRELGLPPIPAAARRPATENDLVHADSGLVVQGPRTWDRSPQPIISGVDATWVDPRSSTAFLSLTIFAEAQDRTFRAIWRDLMNRTETRPGYVAGASSDDILADGSERRRLSFRFAVGLEERSAELVLIYRRDLGLAVALSVAFDDAERDRALEVLARTEAGIVMPADDSWRAPPETEADAPEGGPPPPQGTQRPRETTPTAPPASGPSD